MGFDVDRYWYVRVHKCISGPVSSHTFYENLTCFYNEKSILFCTLELVHQLGGFTIRKGGDGISQVGES